MFVNAILVSRNMEIYIQTIIFCFLWSHFKTGENMFADCLTETLTYNLLFQHNTESKALDFTL